MNEKMPCEMSPEEYREAFSRKLTEVFGKSRFTEEELTEDFYTDLRIYCGDFFKTKEDLFDLNLFCSEGLKNFLLGNP